MIRLIGKLLILSILLGCNKDEELLERQSTSSPTPFSDYMYDDYYIYRVQVGSENTYYTTLSTLLDFNTHFGNSSNNVFDFNGNGVVGTEDQLLLLQGWEQSYVPFWQLEDVMITSQQSSGWEAIVPGWNNAFIKITPWDEYPAGAFIPDQVKSFVIDGYYGVWPNGQFMKVWYYKK